jgi:hypothetical protein
MNYKYVLLLDRAYLLKSLDELEQHGYNPDKDTLYELGRKIRVTYEPKIEEVISAHPKIEIATKSVSQVVKPTWGGSHGT